MRDWASAAFEPRRVAVVGASATPGKLGHLLLGNLVESFEGDVVPVHPTTPEVLGRAAVPRLTAAPAPIDLALVAAPPSATAGIIDDAVSAGVPVVVILGGGFAETGTEGRRREARVRAIAAAGGVRLIGPNCFGLVNAHRRLNASIGLGLPHPGGVSLFTQSGAYGMAAFVRSNEAAMGFARILSAGNKTDIDEVDALRAFAADAETRVIALVLESIANGRELVEALREVTAQKPVVVLKTGRSAAGQRAAAGHTAALASDDVITRAALRQAGARVVDDGATLLDVAAALDRQPPPRGARVGVVTNSGGTGVELTDLLESTGFEVPLLSEALASSLRTHLPSHGSAQNPVDVTTDWRRFAALYGDTIRQLLESGEVDTVVPVLLQRSALDEAVAERVIDETRRAQGRGIDRPVHVCWVAPREAEPNRRRLREAGVPCHDGPAQTSRVLAGCRAAPAHEPPLDVRAIGPPEGSARGAWLRADRALELLAEHDFTVPDWRLAKTREAALAAAETIGFPVVLKAERPGLTHKSDAGGVALDLGQLDDVRRSWDDLEQRFGPGPALVQAQAQSGVELFVGGRRDPQFGPVLAFGLGGVWVEALGDVVWRVAPFGVEEAASMLEEIRGSAVLDGLRGRPAVDRPALARLLADLSALLARMPWCDAFDLNPIIANRNRFWMVDARLRVAE